MLNAKNGVITEERFQKMTTVQWLFHYKEIMKYKNKEIKQSKLMNDSMVDSLYLMGYIFNSEKTSNFIDAIKKAKEKQNNKNKKTEPSSDSQKTEEINIDNVDISDEAAVKSVFEDMYKNTPETVSIPTKVLTRDSKLNLPKFNSSDFKKKKGSIGIVEEKNESKNVKDGE